MIGFVSPSPRREWIEIILVKMRPSLQNLSPSPRREWIEINIIKNALWNSVCLPPHGGSGLKFL